MNDERICKEGTKKKIDSNQIKHSSCICVFAWYDYYCIIRIYPLPLVKELLKMCGNINSNKRCKKGKNKINEQHSQIAVKCRKQIHNAIIGHSNSCSMIFTRTTHYLRKVHRQKRIGHKKVIRSTNSSWAWTIIEPDFEFKCVWFFFSVSVEWS